jgi:hypothetical protein
MVIELRAQLLVWERGLNKRESFPMARENDVVGTEHALERARMECDAEHDWVNVVQQDYRARWCASTTAHWRSVYFNQVLCGHQFTSSVREMDLEWWEEKLAEEKVRGLYSFDGRDLLAELEKLRERVAGVENKRATEAVQLSRSVMEIFDALVDLGVFPIRDIPAQPKSAKDVLAVVSPVLEWLREECAFVAGSDV